MFETAFISAFHLSGQPALYPFLDFEGNMVLALMVVCGCAAILPVLHIGICYSSDVIQEWKYCRKDTR